MRLIFDFHRKVSSYALSDLNFDFAKTLHVPKALKTDFAKTLQNPFNMFIMRQ